MIQNKESPNPAVDTVQYPLIMGLRKVMNNRGSCQITLPKVWINANGIKIGDKLQFMMETNGTLSVRKVSEEGEA